jgi:hypothetical protein
MGAHAEAAFELLRDTLRVTSGPASPDDIVKLLGHALHAHNVHLAELPAGYTIKVEEPRSPLREEVVFTLLADDEGEPYTVTRCTALNYKREEQWVVVPGSTTHHVEADESRGRAVLLLLAAAEVEKRNAQGATP